MMYLLCTYGTEEEEARRKVLYKFLYGFSYLAKLRIPCSLLHRLTIGARRSGQGPTYVYPSALRAVVRATSVYNWQDPTGPQVQDTCTEIIPLFLVLQVYHVRIWLIASGLRNEETTDIHVYSFSVVFDFTHMIQLQLVQY